MQGFSDKKVKPLPTYKLILEEITEQQIFQAYVPEIRFNQTMPSPLGEKDEKPSFSVFWSTRYNKLLFKDHRYGWFGDCFDFVKRLFGYDTNLQALERVCLDFKLDEKYELLQNLGTRNKINVPKLIPKDKIKSYKVTLEVTVRDWEPHDIEYWNNYGITKEWATMANIYPIKYYYINKTLAIPDTHAYVYVEFKDGKTTYKIYQPFNTLNKWISNNNRSVWELWEMMPERHKILIITKSRKDALAIMSTLRIPAVSLQAEGTVPKTQVIKELKERFENIILLYDNDYDKSVNYGRNYGYKLASMFNLLQIEIHKKFHSKDYSDLVKNHGVEKATRILSDLIKNKLIKNDNKPKRDNSS